MHRHLPSYEGLEFYVPRVTPYLPCVHHLSCVACFDKDPVCKIARHEVDLNITTCCYARRRGRYGLFFMIDVHPGQEITILDTDEPLVAEGNVVSTDPDWDGFFPLG